MSDNSNFNTVGNTVEGQNIGVGAGVFAQKQGIKMQFKTLCSAGGTVAFTENNCHINLEATESGPGSAAGNNTEIQYNAGGILGANVGLTYTNTGLTVGSRVGTVGVGSIGVGTSICSSGVGSIGVGSNVIVSSNYSAGVGLYIKSTGLYTHSSGGGVNTKEVLSSGIASFNHSFNNASQTSAHGALANYSAILGGCNHNIEAANTGAIILGGDTIKLTSGYVNTVAMDCMALFSTPTLNVSGDDLLSWNNVSKKIERVSQSSFSTPNLQEVTSEGASTTHQIVSSVATSTAPFSVASTTKVNNLHVNNSTCFNSLASSQFLRSDVADIKTSGDLIFNDNIKLNFGTDEDMHMYHGGTHAYIVNQTGTLNIQPKSGEGGISLYPDSCVQIYYDNSVKFKTVSVGTCTTGVHCSTTCIETPHTCLSSMLFNDGNQSDGYILKSDATGNASWQPSADPTALKVFYVDGNNSDDGDGSILNPYKTIDLAYNKVCGSGSAGTPEYEGVSISIAGYDTYTTNKNLWLSNVTYDFNAGAKLEYTGTDFLFTNDGLVSDTKEHIVNVFGIGEFEFATGSFAHIIGFDSLTTNGQGTGIVIEAESIKSTYNNASNPEIYPLFISENSGATAENHFRRNIILTVNNFINSKSQSVYIIKNRGRLTHDGGFITIGGTSSGDNHSADLRIFKIQRTHDVTVTNTDLIMRWGNYHIELGDESVGLGVITLLKFNNVTYEGSNTSARGPRGVFIIKSGFTIGNNGDGSRIPKLSFNMNYLSGSWDGNYDWILNQTTSTIDDLNFRDSLFPRTKPSNITFTDNLNGHHLANGVTWFNTLGDAKYTTYVENLGVGTTTTMYEYTDGTSIIDNNDNIHVMLEPDSCTALYYNGSEKLYTYKGGTAVCGTLFAGALTVGNAGTAGVIQWCDTGGDLYIYNKDTSSASDIYINPVAGSVDQYYCNALKMCTVSTGICVIGSVSCGSDLRIKNVVGNIDNPIDIINNLCAIKYTSKITNDNCIHFGYVAQEVMSIIPEIVSSASYKEESYIGEIYKSLGIEDEVYGIDYGGIIPVLAEAIKIQQTCINNLETRLTILENI